MFLIYFRKTRRFVYRSLIKIFYTLNYVYWHSKHKKKLKELKEAYKTKKIRVGFLGYLDGPSCDVFTDLYRQFLKNDDFECSIVVVPYTHDYKDKMIAKQDIAAKYLENLNIKPLLGYNKEHDSFNDYSDLFDIVFFEIEYDWVNPLFRADNFRNCLTYIIPYGQYLADNIWCHMTYKMMSEVYCIFPTSVSVQKMMKKYSSVWGKNICPQYLGNPKIDKFFIDSNSFKDVWKKAKPNQKRIIWAPHHTWADYSNFLTYCQYFLDLAQDNEDTLFISIKPHPALKDSLKKINGWSDQQITEYFDLWKNGTNTDIFEGEWYDLFYSSDAMILDSVGFMLEYSLTGKPACVLYKTDNDGDRLMKFSECGEQVYDILYHAQNKTEIEKFIKMVSINEDPKFDLRSKYIKDNYLPPYGNSGSVNIYNYILNTLSSNGTR